MDSSNMRAETDDAQFTNFSNAFRYIETAKKPICHAIWTCFSIDCLVFFGTHNFLTKRQIGAKSMKIMMFFPT